MNHSQLRSFFYGTLLGDSYIHNNVFYCKQVSEDLINFKAKIIKKYLPDAKISILKRPAYTDKNNVNHQAFFVLSVSKSEYIKKLDKIFYPEGKKICPKNCINKLDDLGLALWYADDGTTVLVQFNKTTKSARARRVQLCTDSFSLIEHKNIIVPELKTLDFEPKIIDRARKGQVRIQLNNQFKNQLLFTKIYPYFYQYFPSLLYKMDLGYRGESLLNRRYVSEEYHKLYIEMSAHPLFKDRLIDRG